MHCKRRGSEKPIRERKNINMNKFGGLCREWVGGNFGFFFCFLQRIAKGAGGKGPRQKTSKIVEEFFDTFRQLSRRAKKRQKSSKGVKKFFDTFARHHFSGPFWGALISVGSSHLEKKKHINKIPKNSRNNSVINLFLCVFFFGGFSLPSPVLSRFLGGFDFRRCTCFLGIPAREPLSGTSFADLYEYLF